MRKFTLILVALFAGYFTYSQTVVNNADVVGKGGIVIQSTDDDPDPSIQPGDAGADMSWDFSALAETRVDSIYFLDPGETPYGSDFPTANLAMNATDSGYFYIERNDDKMAMIGLVAELDTFGEINTNVEPEQVMVDFPLAYGNTMVNNYYMMFDFGYDQPGVDSLRIKMSVEESLEADAWGEMTIPMGTYNVLRVHREQAIIDSIWFKSMWGWTFAYRFEFESQSYNWWSVDQGTGYVIATLNVNGVREVQSATYMKSEVLQGTGEFNIDHSMVEVYPNPVEDRLHFEFDRFFEGSIQIIDLTGRVVARQQINGQHATIHFSGQAEGVYIYAISEEGSVSAFSGKFMKR